MLSAALSTRGLVRSQRERRAHGITMSGLQKAPQPLASLGLCLEQDPWSPHKFPCQSFWNVSFTHGEETLSTVHLCPRAAENPRKGSPSSWALRQISWLRSPYVAAFSCAGAQINLL